MGENDDALENPAAGTDEVEGGLDMGENDDALENPAAGTDEVEAADVVDDAPASADEPGLPDPGPAPAVAPPASTMRKGDPASIAAYEQCIALLDELESTMTIVDRGRVGDPELKMILIEWRKSRPNIVARLARFKSAFEG